MMNVSEDGVTMIEADNPLILSDAYLSANTIPATIEELDVGFKKLLEAQAERVGISVEQVVRQLAELPNPGEEANEITNRLRAMLLLADVLLKRPIEVEELKSVARELWVLGNATDSMHRNAFLASDVAAEAIENLLNEDGGVDDLARVDAFVSVATQNGYAPPGGAANVSGAAQFASALLSAVYPERFVDFRANRWNRLFREITQQQQQKLCTGKSYGWRLVRAGKFASALAATNTFKKHFGQEYGTWKAAGLAWYFKGGLFDMKDTSVEADLGDRVCEEDGVAEFSTKVAYWWLNANPKIWDFRNLPLGSIQTYTSRNEKGNKRQKFKYFSKVKPGDLIIGYVTTPDKEIVAICEVTKALHGELGQEQFEFEKIEQFAKTVTWNELKSLPGLEMCEPIQSNQGSLFSVTEEEYDLIRDVLDERNLKTPHESVKPYTRADALQDLFMLPGGLDSILSRLKRKKALILQGPPGVGKTFVARRLAYTMMKMKDDDRIGMVQFHPSYGYEDFIEGYRPTAKGLERREGVFRRFAREARNDPGRDWFFIIDEINRGNLAKIFGELLMLIEADKRGPDYAISLTYSDAEETFYFPENLYIIGTMNRADRSLAMVDYALRRRFAFMTLNPEFNSFEFSRWLQKHGASAEIISKIRMRVNALNQEIEKERDLGSRFLIGHSFFCPDKNVSPDEKWYEEVVDGEIKPLLEEYFDDTSKVEELVTALLS